MSIKTRRRRIHINAGDRYGRFTVIGEAEAVVISGKPIRQALCRCECGNEKIVRLNQLRDGCVKSCGCLHDTLPIKHGQVVGGIRTITYRSWMNVRRRCLNRNAHEYGNYGGRGIRICERWNDFSAFLEDMGERPAPEYSIDRIDPDGDYTPENCRWATMKRQGRNRRNNRMLTHNGETLCVSAWAERIGISKEALKNRLDVCGYTICEAITLPLGAKR